MKTDSPALSERSDAARVGGFARPYVVSWNLTYRCNLACEHCYLDAGGAPQVGTENFADRSELGTEECYRVIDDIADDPGPSVEQAFERGFEAMGATHLYFFLLVAHRTSGPGSVDTTAHYVRGSRAWLV